MVREGPRSFRLVSVLPNSSPRNSGLLVPISIFPEGGRLATKPMKHLLQTFVVIIALGWLTGCSTTNCTHHCKLTGKDLAGCCCIKKDGKLYGTETQQAVRGCCCI